MIIVTTDSVPGQTIQATLGFARGSAARSRNIGADFFAGVKNIVGGEVEQYTRLMAETREQALQRMADEARHMGADADAAADGSCALMDWMWTVLNDMRTRFQRPR